MPTNLIIDWIQNYGVDETQSTFLVTPEHQTAGRGHSQVREEDRDAQRNVHWLICQLQTNELIGRKFIENLDGETDSKTGFSGSIGKMLFKAEGTKPNFKVGPDMI